MNTKLSLLFCIYLRGKVDDLKLLLTKERYREFSPSIPSVNVYTTIYLDIVMSDITVNRKPAFG